MAEAAQGEHPTEYDRPPVYARPIGGLVRVVERVARGMRQAEAITPEMTSGIPK